MSSETPTVESSHETLSTDSLLASLRAQATRLVGVLPSDDSERRRVLTGATVVAACAVGLQTLVLVAHNLPFDPLTLPPGAVGALDTLTAVVVASAGVAVALSSRRDSVTVGLLFVAIFGFVGTGSAAATVPAVVGVVAGGTVALLGSLDPLGNRVDIPRLVVAGAFIMAVLTALTNAVGVLALGSRGTGGSVAVLALAATALVFECDSVDLLVGAAAAVAVVFATAASPFVAGSIFLVGFSMVSVPPLLVALGAGGGTACLVAGVRRRDVTAVAALALVVLAGVPVTPPRAMAVLLGVTVLLAGPDRLLDRSNERGGETL